jgi:hypothetical protein
MAMRIVGAGEVVGRFGIRTSLVGNGDGRRVLRIVGVYVTIDGEEEIVGILEGEWELDVGCGDILGEEVGNS